MKVALLVLLALCFSLPVNETLSVALVGNEQNTTLINSNVHGTGNVSHASENLEIAPTIYKFATKEALFASSFWKKVMKKKNPALINSTVIQIDKENSSYVFADSEATPVSFWRRVWKRRVVELTQIKLGERVSEEIQNIPASPCVASTLSSSGGSYTLTTSSKNDLKIKTGISFGAIFNFGSFWLSLNSDDLTLSLGSSQSISCTIAPTKRVQVFATYNYIYFPKAEVRSIRFAKGMIDFEKKAWRKLGVKGSVLEKFGAVFFDLAKSPQFYCVDDEDQLMCGEELDDPMEELARYSSLSSD